MAVKDATDQSAVKKAFKCLILHVRLNMADQSFFEGKALDAQPLLVGRTTSVADTSRGELVLEADIIVHFHSSKGFD